MSRTCVLVGLSALLGACMADEPETAPGPAVERHATMDDGTRLYYAIAGEGEQVVVVPAALYLSELLAPLADGRRVVFYDPRNRGRSDAADIATVSLDRQLRDLEQLRAHLGLERMALIGWSGMGMEMAAYAIRHPERVTRLVQVAAVPPSAAMMAEYGDQRGELIDQEALDELHRGADAGEIGPQAYCRRYQALTLPANFVDPTFAAEVPDVCRYENEWPPNLWPYFGALLGSFGDYDWRPALSGLSIPRLVIHGREDGIPVEGARAWAAGFPTARLLVLSPAGHFPFLEQPAAFFPAVDEFMDGGWPDAAVSVGQE